MRGQRAVFGRWCRWAVAGLAWWPLAAAAQTGGYAAHQIDEKNGIPIITLAGSYDTTLSGAANAAARAAVAQEFYRTHPDDFDFLVVIPDFAFQSDDGIAFHWSVRSSVQGLGIAPFDEGSFFGSASRLLGFIDMPALGQIETDPTQPGFEFTLNTLAHEVLHQWGIHSHLLDAAGNLSNELIGQQQAHWSNLVDTSASVEYGNQWQDNGDGTFTSIAVRRFYSPLDLYLAGFYDASEVPPFLVITSPGADPAALPQLGQVLTGTGRMVSIDQIVAADGPRVPAAAQAQHAYRAAFIFLIRPGDVATDAQLAALDTVRREWMTHFSVLTGGRGTFEVTSEAPPPPTGSPTPVSPGPLRPTAASLPAAFTWLRAQQTAAGYWQDTPSTRPRDTAVVLPALVTLDAQFTAPSRQLALSWLGAQAGNSNDDLAHLASALGSAPLAAQLIAAVNPDGGWGLGAGYASDALDTALAVQWLATQPATPPAVVAAAARFLLAGQGTDGGWAPVPGGASRTGPTAAALEALKASGAAAANPGAVAKAFIWLAAKQNGDGGFGDSLSTAHDTAAAILAALDLNSAALNLQSATAYLDSHQASTGSWEGSTFTTASVLLALARFSFPNWAFGGPMVAVPAAPNDGDKVTLTFTVLSNGNSATPAGALRVYDGDPAAGGIAIGPDAAIPPLGPTQSATVTTVWDTTGRAGNHNLVAVIDPDNQVTEVTKSDNRTSLAILVGPAPAGIDLAVTAADITVSPSHPASLPVQLAISAIVRNAGLTDALTTDVRLYIGTPGAGGTAVADTVIAVPNRSSAVANFTYTLTTPGTTVFTVVADPDNQLGDVDRSNNSASVSVTTAANIDLAVAPSDVVLTGPAYLGRQATFQVTLHNLGTVDAPTTGVTYAISDGTATETLPSGAITLAAGASVQDTVTWPVDRTGNLTFTVTINPGNGFVDSNPANNQASLAFTATAVQQADVSVGRGDLSVSPNPALVGSPLAATAVVHNTGGQDVTHLQVAFYDGDPTQGAPLLGAMQVIADLAAGSTATVSATEASVTGAGNHLIYVVVDPNDLQTGLFSRAALSTFIVVPALALPDAAISSASLVLQPAFPAPGLPVTLNVTVQNLGQQSIANLQVGAWDGDPAAGGTPIGTAIIPLLPVGGNAAATIGWTLAAGAGSRTLYVIVDPNNLVAESNKANNTASLPIVVAAGDFVVSNRYFSPNGDGVQDTTEFDFRLSASMTVQIAVRNAAGTVVRTAAGSAYANVAGGSFVWDGRDDRGVVVFDGDYTLQVASPDGTVQGQAVATVDTNRSPLLAAAGTPFGAVTNLTCSIQPGRLTWSPDEQAIFFLQYQDVEFPQGSTGVYRMTPLGSGVQQVVQAAFFGASAPTQVIGSLNGSTIAFDSVAFAGGNGPTGLWTAPADGSAPPAPLTANDGGIIAFSADGSSVAVFDSASSNVVLLPVGGGTPRVLVNLPNAEWEQAVVSPDAQRMLMPVQNADDSITDWWMVNLVDGGATQLELGGGNTSAFAWSPDSAHAAGSVLEDGSEVDEVVLVDREGSISQSWIVPDETPPNFPTSDGTTFTPTASTPQWSWTGDALAFDAGYVDRCGSWVEVVTLDIATGLLTPIAHAVPTSPFCLSFHISTWDGHQWVERAVVHHSPHLGQREVDLSRFLPDATGSYRVRIRQVGGAASSVAGVTLAAGALRLRPSDARRLDGGQDLRAALGALARHRQPVDFHDAEMELSWQRVPRGRRLRLRLEAAEADHAGDLRLPAAAGPGTPPPGAGRTAAASATPATTALGPQVSTTQLPLFNPTPYWSPYQYALAINGELGGVDSAYIVDVSAFAGPGAAATAAAVAAGGALPAAASPVQLLAQLPGLNIMGFSPFGRYMLFGYNDTNVASATCVEPDRFTWSFSSLMNLTSDLRLRQVPGLPGYVAEGTAVDLNFARYQFDFADAAVTPASWTPLGPPVPTSLIDGQFTTWAPPAAGTWLLRLTAQDQAGNSATSVQQVSTNASPIISNISLTPLYISPNGDGVQDTADIHFQVTQPVHLDFHFVDGSGTVVRTLPVDQAEAGSFDVPWDGRDDSGQVVRDGEYTMEVLGFTFPVIVVTKPPTLKIEVDGSLDCEPPGVGFNPVLFASASASVPGSTPTSDSVAVPIVSQSLETGAGPEPLTWTPVLPGFLTGAQYVNMSFRIRATDAAGNTGERVLPAPGPQNVLLSGLATKAFDPTTGLLAPVGGPCALGVYPHLPRAITRLQITETVVAPLVQVFVETAPIAAISNLQPEITGAWVDEPITTFFAPSSVSGQAAPPDFRFELDWDMANVPPGVPTAVRIRAVDANGTAYFTDPVVQIAGVGVSFGSLIGQTADAAPPAIASLVRAAGLNPPADPVIYATADYPGLMATMALTIQSSQDAHYNTPRTFEPVIGDGTNFIYTSRDWQPCTTYFLHFVGQALPQVDPLTGAVLAPTLVADGTVGGDNCVQVAAQLEPDPPAAACGQRASTMRVLDVTPHSLDGSPLLQLAISGPGGLLQTINAPQSSTTYRYNFDLAQLADGGVTFQAVVTNTKGQVGTGSAGIVNTHTPPVVSITSPQAGQTVCGVDNRVWIYGASSSAYALFANGGQVSGGADIPPPPVSGPAGGCGPSLGLPPGAIGAVCNVSGPINLELAAANESSYTECTTTTFTVDASVAQPQITAAPVIFSPNGDGALDTLGVDLQAGEPTHVDVEILPAGFDSNGNCVPTGDAIGRVAAALAVGTTPVPTLWDGLDPATGKAFPDGLYQFVAHFTDDSCGNTAQVATCAAVDDTPPQVAIDFPQATDPLPLVIEITGLADDLHFASWTLDFAAAVAPNNFSLIATSTQGASHQFMASWNTYGLVGQYLLRLRAVDLAGNTSQVVVPLTIASAANLITSLAGQPRLFSPNGDGRLDTIAITLALGIPANATLVVKDGGGQVVRTLLAGTTEPAGAAVATWDGTTDAGTPAGDGTYSVVLTAASVANPAFVETQSVTVVLDRTPPAIAVTRPPSPNGFVTPTGSILGSIADDHLQSWSVSLTSSPQAPTWTQIASGTTNVNGAPLGSLEGLAEGSYAIKVDATDAGQIQSEQIIVFTVDSTPPVATLTAPAAGAVLGAVGGPVAVSGSVTEAHIQSWQVQLGAGAQPSAWTTLGSGTSLPVPAPAVAWTASGVPDGPYVLRLFAQDLAGQTGQAQVAVTIDNTPPVVAITTPADGSYVTGPMNVTGTATDANLLQYTLAVAPGPKGASQQFSTVGVGASPVSGGLLLSWTALPPDGIATLRLTATDKAGNTSSAYAQVTVHTQPPPAPQGLAAQVNQQTVELSWLASAVPAGGVAVAGYRVYRNGEPLDTAQLVTALTFNDTGVAPGTYAYTVVAVDQAGLASAPSAPAQATVDLAQPVALISKPRNGGRAGGLVSIIGTASKTSGFKQYTVTALANDGSGAQQLLRTSPLPVQGGLLAQWNTIGIADGSSFTLRLVAEDVSGNSATAEVTVTTDNTPPAAPTGLTATPSGSDVQVAWNANTEPDLAGYLLYRNGKLANASGPVIGDLTPYLLASPSFADRALPDGTFTYVVYAVDTAGNQSLPSDPASATLDNHAPHVVITAPVAGTAFQTSVQVIGSTDDLDVASVQFQWQPAGAAGWNNLGAAVTSPPWEVVWDATTIAYGNYMIQAVATDLGGRTDPAPAPIAVVHKNLEQPPAPTALTAQVTGGTVKLAWTAGAPVPADLAGYLVDRTAADGTVTHVVASPLAATSFTDSGVPDGSYGYTVTAVNQAGNASDPAGPAAALVYSLALVQPYTPTSATATAIAGSNAALSSQVGGSVALAAGGAGTPIGPVAVDASGSFAFLSVPLARGDNLVSVAATDAAGNVSKAAAVPVFTADLPSPPSGLTATPGSGLAADLSWNANPASETVLGYRLQRDGKPAPDPVLVDTPWTATASTPAAGDANAAQAAIDGDETTYWQPNDGADPDPRNQWIEVDWPVQRLVARVELDWASEGDQPLDAGDFDIQGWDGRVWVPLAAVRGDAAAATVVTLSQSYLTSKLRLHLVATSSLPWLAEMRIYAHVVPSGTAVTDAAPNGMHTYQVIAVGPQGLESQPSAAVTVAVGDVTPPAAVTLSGAAVSADVGLTWTPSAGPNVTSYQVLREGVQIAQVPLPGVTAYTDAGRPNGIWHYTVEAVDTLGNVSAPSNVVAVTVAVSAPAPPTGLAVAAVATGGALQLTWTPSAGAASSVTYEIERATVSGGPYQVVATVAASPATDGGLTNGTRYDYVVVAVDGAGNASAPSNEASGVPADTAPPAPPVLTAPAVSILPFATADDNADLAGSAEPGSTVVVTPAAGGTVLVAPASAAVAETAATGLASTSVPLPAPNGRYALVPAIGGAAASVYDFDAAGGPTSSALPVTAGAQALAWMADGRGVLVAQALPAGGGGGGAGGTVVQAYRFAGAATATLANLDWATSLAAAPDGDRVAVLGSQGGQSGLWVLDPAASTWSLVAAIDPSQAAPQTLVWSPEGSWLAYVGPAPAGAVTPGGGGAAGDGASGLVVVGVAAPNAATLVEPSPGSGRPSFLPDGSAVAFTQAQAAGGEKVRLTVLASGATVDLTDLEGGPLLPQLSPDGGFFAYVDEAGLEVAPLSLSGPAAGPPAAATLSTLGGELAGDLAWVAGGYLLAATDDEVRVAPAGRFAAASVALALGDNRFTATARDAAGNVSGAGASRLIRRAASNLPDLAIGATDMALLPAAPLPGQSVRVTVTVHNLGPAASPATTLALTAYGPGGAQVSLATALAVPAMASGGAATVAQDGAIDGPAGAWSLVAQVDPQAQVEELSKSNNQAQIAFQVVNQGPPALSVTTDQPSYAANGTLTATVTVFNGSASFSGQLAVAIEDTQGTVVATLPVLNTGPLDYGQQFNQTMTWGVGSTFAGAYLVDVKLLDGGGASVAEATAPFAITVAEQLTATVTTDSASYQVGASVHLAAQVGYPAGNTPLSGLLVHLQVLGPVASGGGTPPVAGDWTLPLGTLLPGAQGAVSANWSSAGAAAATYQIAATVLDGSGNAAASAATEISLTAAAPKVTGSLTLANRAPSWGQPVTATYRLQNGGAAALTQVPVRVRALDATTGVELARQSASVDLAAGGSASGTVSFDSTVLGLGSRLAVLEADLPVSGSGGGVQTTTLALVGFTVDDRTPPTVAVTQPAAGAVEPGAFTVQVTATDPLSTLTAVTLSVDGGAPVVMSLSNPATATWSAALSGLAAGTHTVQAQATDAAGNAGTSASVSFTVSAAPPTITITGVAPGGLYNVPVTPVVAVTASTPTYTAVITLDGQTFASGTPVAAEGNHTLTVAVTDANGVQASASLTFTIDRTPPVITIGGVTSGSLYNAAVTPVVTVSDAHPGTTTITLNGQPFVSGSAVSAEGSYALAVTATDAAGNTAQQSVTFALDRTPPVIVISGVTNGDLYNAAVTPTVTVTDAHPGTTTITLNGQPFVSGSAVSAEGTYALAVTATDAAGNTAQQSVTFALDRTPPVISIGGVTNGGLYNAAVTPTVTVTDSHAGTTTITLNGQPFVSGSAVSAEGSYTLAVTATDAAGNTAQQSATFTLDRTPPVIAIGGVTSGGLYDAAVTPVVTVTDAHPGTTAITLNGQPFASGSAVSAEGSYTLAVTATDAAGNTAQQSVSFTIDRTAPVITITGVTDGASYSSAVTPVVTVTDAHPGTTTITLNGQTFASGTAVSAAGSYTLAVTATDAAGNQAQKSVGFTIVSAQATLSIADATVTQPAVAAIAALFPVTLSAPASSAVSVDFATSAGSATAGVDFLPVGGVLSFAPGVTVQTVSVPVLANPALAAEATFVVQLSQPQGAGLSRATAVGSIVPVAACTSANLLANPGAEMPQVSNLIPGWDVVTGSAWQVASAGAPPAYEGDDDLATSDAAGELRQDVDLLAYAAQIATPGQSFAFSGELRTVNAGGGGPASTARIVVEYRDQANQNVLASFDSGAVASAGVWTPVADQRPAPAGTRWIRVRLLSGLPASGGGLALFDGMSLTSVATPVLAALDAAAATPAAGQQQAVAVRVRLSCAATQTVTVHYATVDDTAVAGTDYQAAAGSLSFPPGSVEQDVTLTALGLAADQVDREFGLALTQPGNAALARATAVVRLLPRPFCAQPPTYWRHHPESWTVNAVSMGGTTYSSSAALWMLQYAGSDPLYLLAQQLAATRLDLAAGAPTAGQAPAANADSFLVQHPLGSVLSAADAQTAAGLISALAAYDSATCPLVCSADPLGVAGRFNAFVLGNLTQSATDTAGRLAAAGSVTLASYSVGQSLTATGGTDDVLVAGGNLSWNGGTASHGNVVYGGTVSLTSVSIPNGATRQDQPIDFAGAGRNLTILASYWATLAANGTTTVQPWKAIQLTGSDPTLDIFTVHGSDLAAAVSLSIQVPSGATALLNIDGTSDQMQNFGFQLSGVGNGGVVYNFYQATSLHLSGIGVPGTVLAPRAAVSFSNGNVNGTLVGASVSGGGQFNQGLFTGCLPVGH